MVWWPLVLQSFQPRVDPTTTAMFKNPEPPPTSAKRARNCKTASHTISGQANIRAAVDSMKAQKTHNLVKPYLSFQTLFTKNQFSNSILQDSFTRGLTQSVPSPRHLVMEQPRLYSPLSSPQTIKRRLKPIESTQQVQSATNCLSTSSHLALMEFDIPNKPAWPKETMGESRNQLASVAAAICES